MAGGGSLTIVGTGIRAAGQLTLEALHHIRNAERLLYLAGDAVAARYLGELNPNSASLADAYAEGRPRTESYRDMTDRILQPVRQGQRVVAAFYGHPAVGGNPAHAALSAARAEGYDSRLIAGISAEACLLADLAVDPLHAGFQSYEAWRFVARPRRFDPRVPLLLWQVGLIYQPSIDLSGAPNRRGLRALAARLRRTYDRSHPVVLYEASPFAVCDARIERLPLAALSAATVSTATSLFVPPKPAS